MVNRYSHIKLIPLWAGHLLTFGDPSRNKAKIILCSENSNNLNKNKNKIRETKAETGFFEDFNKQIPIKYCRGNASNASHDND